MGHTEIAETHRHRWGARLAMAALWCLALTGYFSPWIGRRPMTAALAWNGYDLFDMLRLLPEIESGALSVNLQALRLPLLALALLAPLLAHRAAPWVRIGAAAAGAVLALVTLPPYPQILTAWRTPGWRVPFWWGIGAAGSAATAWWWGPRLGRYLPWLAIGIIALALVPAASTLGRLLPALRTLHAAPVRPAWGFWCCLGSLVAIGLVHWGRAVRRTYEPV